MTDDNIRQPEQRQIHLRVPRDKALQRIKPQIEEGENLLNTPIKNREQLNDAQYNVTIWISYTEELLRYLFDTEELAYRFSGFGAYIERPYTFQEAVADLRKKLREHLAQLDAIYKQVEQGLFLVKAPQPPPSQDEAGRKPRPMDRFASEMGQICGDKTIQAKEERLEPRPPKAMGIFFAYAREDEDLRDELEKHLSILKRKQLITGWHDRRIGAGREWEGEIDKHLNTAQLILLLVSSDFLASDYCWDVEVKRAMERHEAGEARVIPVILRPVDWKSALFGKLQALPTDAKPVTIWSDRDEAFFDVAQGIRAAVVDLGLIEMYDTRRWAYYTLTKGIEREVSQRTDYADIDLNARQVKAMQYLEKHGEITSAIYCEGIAPRISQRMARKDLKDLVERGMVIRVGHTRGTRYVLPTSE